MQDQTLDKLIGLPLKKIGILISRISLGTPIGLVYVELRQRENDELAVEMYTKKGQSIDPLKLIGSPPPAFCSKFSNNSSLQIMTTEDYVSADYHCTIIDISDWINKSKLQILGYEFPGLKRDGLNQIELNYIKKFNAEKIGLEIYNELLQSGKPLWISNSVIDTWDTDENLVYEDLAKLAVCDRGGSGVRITLKPSFIEAY